MNLKTFVNLLTHNRSNCLPKKQLCNKSLITFFKEHFLKEYKSGFSWLTHMFGEYYDELIVENVCKKTKKIKLRISFKLLSVSLIF